MDIRIITGIRDVQSIRKLNDIPKEHWKMATVLVNTVYPPLEEMPCKNMKLGILGTRKCCNSSEFGRHSKPVENPGGVTNIQYIAMSNNECSTICTYMHGTGNDSYILQCHKQCSGTMCVSLPTA
jgi:hypothetical protein